MDVGGEGGAAGGGISLLLGRRLTLPSQKKNKRDR